MLAFYLLIIHYITLTTEWLGKSSFFLHIFWMTIFFLNGEKKLSYFLVCKFQNWYNVVISLNFHYVLVVGHIIVNSTNKMMLKLFFSFLYVYKHTK
jgi:hypothetical protein